MKKIALFLFLCLLGFAPHSFSENVADGGGALAAVTTGQENVGIGSYALPSLTTGHGNTALGTYAGRSALTVNGGVYLGYGAGGTNTSAHKLFIQTMFYPTYGIFGDFSTGYFGINNSSPSVALDVTGNAAISGNVAISGTVLYKQPVEFITAAADTLLAAQTGTLFVARPLGQKSTAQLCAAAAGLTFDFMVADADSLLIQVASGDSLIISAGNAYVTTSSVAGTVKLIAIDGVRWLMQYTLGTWTSY